MFTGKKKSGTLGKAQRKKQSEVDMKQPESIYKGTPLPQPKVQHLAALRRSLDQARDCWRPTLSDNRILKFLSIQPQAVPKTGTFVVWKICWEPISMRRVYVRLLASAKTPSVTPIACGCDQPTPCLLNNHKRRFLSMEKVLSFEDYDGNILKDVRVVESYVYGGNRQAFKYWLGQPVKANGYDSNPYNCCGPGISVYLTKDECNFWLL